MLCFCSLHSSFLICLYPPLSFLLSGKYTGNNRDDRYCTCTSSCMRIYFWSNNLAASCFFFLYSSCASLSRITSLSRSAPCAQLTQETRYRYYRGLFSYVECLYTICLMVEQCFGSLYGFLATLCLILHLILINLHLLFFLFLLTHFSSLQFLQPLTL